MPEHEDKNSVDTGSTILVNCQFPAVRGHRRDTDGC